METGSPFVGRDDDLDALCALLGVSAVVTITGPGGIGKTRLALEVADRAAASFPGGVLVAELAAAGPDDDIGDVVARRLGRGSLDEVRIASIGQRTLVIVDDCERMVGAVREVVDQLVADDADLVVLATSRVPLDMAAEHRYPLEPLPLDDPTGGAGRASEAVRLFVDRARAAGASWPETEENLDAADAIVHRLDGMPLAIELAAARSRAIAPRELAPLLDRQLDLLRRPAHRAGERHGDIRSVIHASYDPMTTAQRALLRALSHFAAPFDLDLAHRVAGVDDDPITTLEMLSDLVDHSLVMTSHDQQGRTHYRLLEPIRAYGREQLDVLGETAVTDERYIATITAFADEVVAEALERFSAEVIDRIADRYAHLLAAIHACIDRDDGPDRAFRLFLPFYAPTRAPRAEVARMGRRVLDRWPGVGAPFEAEALAVMAHASLFAGEDADAVSQARSAIGHPHATPLAHTIAERVLGYVAGRNGDRPEGLRHLEAAMAAAEPLGGAFARELRMSWAAMVDDPARIPEALAVLDEAAAAAAAEGETLTLVWAAVAAAHLSLVAGDLEAAGRSAARATQLADRTLAPWAAAAAQRVTASLLTIGGDWDDARRTWLQGLDQVVTDGDVAGITLTVRTAAGAAEATGRPEVAEALWAALPAHKGASTLVPLFADEEDRLHERLGVPVPLPVPEAVRRSRAVLADGEDRRPVSHPGAGSPEARVTTAQGDRTVLRFGGYEIDLGSHELRLSGARVHTEPQVFDVLAYLATNAGRMVSREELMDEVWGDRFVSPSAVSSRIKSARSATGDDGRAQRVIRTVHGRGFMFVADLR